MLQHSTFSRTTSWTMRPRRPPRVYTLVTPESLDACAPTSALRESRRGRRPSTRNRSRPVRVPYERELGRGDRRGADIVVGHRAHPPRVEIYRGAGLPWVELRRRHPRSPLRGSADELATWSNAARAVRLRARDAVLPLPPGKPQHDDRRLPIESGSNPVRAADRRRGALYLERRDDVTAYVERITGAGFDTWFTPRTTV